MTSRVSSRQGAQGEEGYTVMGNIFRVNARRYKDLKAIGKGSYGVVCSAVDVRRRKKVAIKKITPMAQHAADAKHVLREIRLMRYLGVHPNVIALEDVFVREMHDELYIVMELLDSDLHRIIQSPQTLSDAHHRYFMYQLLRGVQFLHDNRIIHRDLKPGNLLVTKNCQLKITDFGLARARPLGGGPDPDDAVDQPMTEHVVTRWYRPPELMLCPDGLYTYAVDMWSVGCIFAELLGRQPLFPGKNFVDQLTLIFDVVGSPRQEEVAHIRNSQALKFLDSMVGKPRVPCAHLFPAASEPAISLLDKLLIFHPPLRLTVAEALEHPYFEPLRSTDTRKDPIVSANLEFEFETLDMARLPLKSLIIQEVTSFRCEQHRRDQERAAAAEGSGSTTSQNQNNPDLPSSADRFSPEVDRTTSDRARANSDDSSTVSSTVSSRYNCAAARAAAPTHGAAIPAAEAATVKAGGAGDNGRNGWRGNGHNGAAAAAGASLHHNSRHNAAANNNAVTSTMMDQDSPLPRSSSSSEDMMQPLTPETVGETVSETAAAEEAAAEEAAAAAAAARQRQWRSAAAAPEHGSSEVLAQQQLQQQRYASGSSNGNVTVADGNGSVTGVSAVDGGAVAHTLTQSAHRGRSGSGGGGGGGGGGRAAAAAAHGASAGEADLDYLRKVEAMRQRLQAGASATRANGNGAAAADGTDMVQSPPAPPGCDADAVRDLEGSMDRLRMHKRGCGSPKASAMGLAAYWRSLRPWQEK